MSKTSYLELLCIHERSFYVFGTKRKYKGHGKAKKICSRFEGLVVGKDIKGRRSCSSLKSTTTETERFLISL